MGPPIEPPKLSHRLRLTEGLKVFRELKKLFWRYSYPAPWMLLEPPLLIWLHTAPPMPYCAEKLEVWICTSSTVSKIATSKLSLWGNITEPPSAMMLK